MKKYISLGEVNSGADLYDFVRLLDEGGNLIIDLAGRDAIKLRVEFESYLFYSKQDEGDALRTLSSLKEASVIGRTVVKAEGSDLLRWISEESFGIRAENGLSHYIIVTVDDILNVVCLDEPLIAVLR